MGQPHPGSHSHHDLCEPPADTEGLPLPCEGRKQLNPRAECAGKPQRARTPGKQKVGGATHPFPHRAAGTPLGPQHHFPANPPSGKSLVCLRGRGASFQTGTWGRGGEHSPRPTRASCSSSPPHTPFPHTRPSSHRRRRPLKASCCKCLPSPFLMQN